MGGETWKGMKIEQSALLKIGSVAWPVIVISKNFFKFIACPIVKDAVMGMFDYQA